jgi:sulfur carrier protein
MRVTVNGERRETAAASVAALLRELEYDGSHFAVAVNADVVPRARWAEQLLRGGDTIEILTPRQGG